MNLSNVVKAILFFGAMLLVLTLIVQINASITNSDAWDIVPSGLAKYLAVLLPLILLFGFLIKSVVMGSKRKRDE